MANITRGHTFSSGDLVTADKLHNLVDSASIANIAEAALADGSHIITSGTTAPAAATAGHAWWDTSGPEADGYGILKIHDGTRWQSVAKNVEQYYLNSSGGDLTYGDLVIFDTSAARSVTTTTSVGSTKVAGVIASAADGLAVVGNGNEGRVVRSGLVMVKTTGTVTLGDYLGTSDTVKLAKSLGSSQVVGAFGIAVKDTGTTDQKWLVALSGHTVDYVQKTTTDVLVEQTGTLTTCTNNSQTVPDAGGSIPGTSTADDGTTPPEDTWMQLTWYNNTLDPGQQEVTIKGDVIVAANQVIHATYSGIGMAVTGGSISTTQINAIRIKIQLEATTVTGITAGTVVSSSNTIDLADNGYDMDVGTTVGGISSNYVVHKGHCLLSYAPTLPGTYTAKVMWLKSNSTVSNYNILNPRISVSGGDLGSVHAMQNPSLKVVTR